jgi:hypothetical protein
VTYGCIDRSTKTGCCSGTVHVSTDITRIESNAFSGCSDLKEVIIATTVQYIESEAFQSTGLVEVEIPTSVTSVSCCVFRYCENLQRAVIPTSVSYIASDMFYNCYNLKSVSLPSSIQYIDRYAFENTGLKSVFIPSSVTRIEDYAFQNTQLRNVTLPSTMRDIGNQAFYGCSSLESIVIQSSSITQMSYTSFGGSTCSTSSHVVYLPAPNLYSGQFDSCTVMVMAPTQGAMSAPQHICILTYIHAHNQNPPNFPY